MLHCIVHLVPQCSSVCAKHRVPQCSAVCAKHRVPQCSAVQCSAVYCSAVQCSAVCATHGTDTDCASVREGKRGGVDTVDVRRTTVKCAQSAHWDQCGQCPL